MESIQSKCMIGMKNSKLFKTFQVRTLSNGYRETVPYLKSMAILLRQQQQVQLRLLKVKLHHLIQMSHSDNMFMFTTKFSLVLPLTVQQTTRIQQQMIVILHILNQIMICLD